MLAYAFRVLSESGYVKISTEKFDNTTSLLSAILDKGVTQLIKQGIRNDYVSTVENTISPIGKINIADSIKANHTLTHKLVCEHEKFLSDIILNQIIKATIAIAIRSSTVDINIQKRLRRNLLYFNGVSNINSRDIKWEQIRYDRNSASYKMLVNICYLLITGLLQCEDETGEFRVANIIDDQKMHRLYERFILEYYKRHYPMLHVSAARILWDSNDTDLVFLPTMKSDVTIRYNNKTMVIDAKYYGKTMQTGQFDKKTIHSNNIYQIFTYVSNMDTEDNGDVSGSLLYAKTDEEITPDAEFTLKGKNFRVTTLDLGCEFEVISGQLDDIINKWADQNNLQDCIQKIA